MKTFRCTLCGHRSRTALGSYWHAWLEHQSSDVDIVVKDEGPKTPNDLAQAAPTVNSTDTTK